MTKKVIAIFDIGKTNKKVLLFDDQLQVVYQQEDKFAEITDDDGFACDDIEALENWMFSAMKAIVANPAYDVKAVNFSTYGASLMYLGAEGKRLTPVYNYLKPMPEGVVEGIYAGNGGVDEFSRCTASPALGMLNSGLQALWLKKEKPEVYAQVKEILHFPQYLSYLFTGKVYSEYTSIGCHTALWNFDKKCYHQWLADEGISLPQPGSNSQTDDVIFEGKKLTVGVGIHDSSASLVPYLKGSADPFILVSTGTWSIAMNPFNSEPLTAEQLSKDCLCYMSVNQEQVKSSRLMMGYIHEMNAERLSKHFNCPVNSFKFVKADVALARRFMSGGRVFFAAGVPEGYVDQTVDLSQFASYDEAYHRLMVDLTALGIEAIDLVVPQQNNVRKLFISGGFAKNELFVRLLASQYADMEVYTSECDNATAIGAALVVWDKIGSISDIDLNLGLKKWEAI